MIEAIEQPLFGNRFRVEFVGGEDLSRNVVGIDLDLINKKGTLLIHNTVTKTPTEIVTSLLKLAESGGSIKVSILGRTHKDHEPDVSCALELKELSFTEHNFSLTYSEAFPVTHQIRFSFHME